jgi:hypothetical protein
MQEGINPMPRTVEGNNLESVATGNASTIDENPNLLALKNSEHQTIREQVPSTLPTGTNNSALSLSSIRVRRELLESTKGKETAEIHLPTAAFNETDLLVFWTKYAQKLEDKGSRIVAPLLTYNKPTLNGTTIVHELPNQSSKIDFEREIPALLGYLRGMLHNHDITIQLIVNENSVIRKTYTIQDKYNRLNEINPNLDYLKRIFELDI